MLREYIYKVLFAYTCIPLIGFNAYFLKKNIWLVNLMSTICKDENNKMILIA